MSDIEKIIEDAWKKRNINQNSEATIIDSINQIIEDLDAGKIVLQKKLIMNGLLINILRKQC